MLIYRKAKFVIAKYASGGGSSVFELMLFRTESGKYYTIPQWLSAAEYIEDCTQEKVKKILVGNTEDIVRHLKSKGIIIPKEIREELTMSSLTMEKKMIEVG